MIAALIIFGIVCVALAWSACVAAGRDDDWREHCVVPPAWAEDFDRIVKEVDKSYQANKEHRTNDNS